MTAQKIIFFPKNVEVDNDESQGMFFVNVETEPFKLWGDFVENKKWINGKPKRVNSKTFYHLKLMFKIQKEVENFLALTKKKMFLEVESSKNSDVISGKINSPEGKEVFWIHEDNPHVKKVDNNNEKQGAKSSQIMKREIVIITLTVSGMLIFGIIFSLWWCKKRKKLSNNKFYE